MELVLKHDFVCVCLDADQIYNEELGGGGGYSRNGHTILAYVELVFLGFWFAS